MKESANDRAARRAAKRQESVNGLFAIASRQSAFTKPAFQNGPREVDAVQRLADVMTAYVLRESKVAPPRGRVKDGIQIPETDAASYEMMKTP
jgi:hypothetical protein